MQRRTPGARRSRGEPSKLRVADPRHALCGAAQQACIGDRDEIGLQVARGQRGDQFRPDAGGFTGSQRDPWQRRAHDRRSYGAAGFFSFVSAPQCGRLGLAYSATLAQV